MDVIPALNTVKVPSSDRPLVSPVPNRAARRCFGTHQEVCSNLLKKLNCTCVCLPSVWCADCAVDL